MTKEVDMLALADYLYALEANMMKNDADMVMDSCDPPSVWADCLRAAAVPTPVMQAAVDASARVAGWSEAKQDYANRATAPDAGLVEIKFIYVNYRGEEAVRRAKPISIRYGSSEFHKETQWLMLAHDIEKNAEREFAMRDMTWISPPDAVLALLFSRAVAGEPVAWRRQWVNGKGWAYLTNENPDQDMTGWTPLYAHPAPSGRDPATIEAEARFLLDRLEELDDADDAEYVRKFEGHVRPPMSRLRRLLPHS